MITTSSTDTTTQHLGTGRALISVVPGARNARVALRSSGVVPWLVSRGPASASVAIGAGGALLLGGDAVQLDVVVAPGCVLALQDIGGTVAYDGDGRPASWAVNVVLGAGARLVWRALPFVVANGAEVTRSMTLSLGAGASALVRETVILGRAGEPGGSVTSRLSVKDASGPLLVETLRVRGDDPVPGVLGEHRVVDSVLALGDQSDATFSACADSMPDATMLRLERGGYMVRALGTDAHAVDLGAMLEHMDLASIGYDQTRAITEDKQR